MKQTLILAWLAAFALTGYKNNVQMCKFADVQTNVQMCKCADVQMFDEDPFSADRPLQAVPVKQKQTNVQMRKCADVQMFDEDPFSAARPLQAATVGQNTQEAAVSDLSGAYISGVPGKGYWQKLVIEQTAPNKYKVAVTSGGAGKGCSFNAEGLVNNKRIEIELKKIKPDLKAVMTIAVRGDTASVFCTNFDDRLNLMWFCGAGGTLAGEYVRVNNTETGISWYKMLSGKIDSYPVTLHLHKAGHEYSGYYYYDTRLQPIYVVGEDSSIKGKVKLIGFSDPENNEVFVFSLSGDNATGNWKKTEKAKSLPFRATAAKAPRAFIYVFANGNVPLRAALKDGPTASYQSASIWPAGNTPTDAFLKNIVRKSFDEKNTGSEDIGAIFLNEKKKFFADYLRDNKDVSQTEMKQSPQGYTLDETTRLMVAYQSPKLLTLAYFNYAYTGGAHGNYGTSFTCVDLTNNKILALSDVLNPAGQKALPGLLEKSFKKNNGLAATDSLQEGGLFENKISPNENFFLTPGGLGFNYTPYEIGPYAMGEVNIFIPMQELQSYLQPLMKSLL